MQLKQMLTLFITKLLAGKTTNDQNPHLYHLKKKKKILKGMICKDVVKPIYTLGSICFTASGARTT